MNIPEIFVMARELTDTNAVDFSDDRLLPFLNRVKDDLFIYLITGAGENWNWDEWLTDSVVGQTEYVIPEAASDLEGNLKITSVNINYDKSTYDDGSLQYIRVKEINPAGLPRPWNFYENKQSKSNPLYYIADKSIFIAPTPISENGPVTNGIQLKGIKSILNYTVTTSELNTRIPIYLHDTLVQGLLPYIHRAEGRKDEASFELKEYRDMRDLAVDKFKNRSTGPHFISYPDEIDRDLDANDFIINQTP